MAEKPPPPDQNVLVYVSDYQNATIQTSLNQIRQQPNNITPSSYRPGYDSPRCDSVRSEAAESTCSSSSSNGTIDLEPSDYRQESIAPPLGWKRLLTNGIIIYVSPSNTALTSIEQVKSYLQTEGTCKCGLDCPVNCDVTFNFNPKVLNRTWTAPVIRPGDLTKLCNHKRKLLTHQSVDIADNRYDGVRKKKRKVFQPFVSRLLSQREPQISKEQQQQPFNGLPWSENPHIRNAANGYQDDNQYRYQDNPGQYLRLHEGANKFPTVNPQDHALNIPNNVCRETYEPRHTYPPAYENKYKTQEVQDTTPITARSQNLNLNRTPPWHQKQNIYERVPPLHNMNVPGGHNWAGELKKKQQTKIRKRYSDDAPVDQPSFMDDPTGYLAQQTALLNSTISRQSVEVPLASNLNKYNRKSRNFNRYPDSSVEKRKEEPNSTQDKNDEIRPIQGATVSTSNRSPAENSPLESTTTVVTTMASGRTASSNTLTSVLAGRGNTATVTVNNSSSKSEDVIKSGPILVSSNGQLIVANSMMSPPIQKTTSPSTSQVINQSAVLVNTLPGQLLLQPSMVVDNINTVQLPHLVNNVLPNQVVEESHLLSPESKRKNAALKKRKMSPVGGSMVLSPQGNNNVMVQQQLNQPVLQALTLLPGKTNFAGTQQLITANMLQPLNLVQNFPIQQFIVPAGVSGMVMSDGTILQDAVQLNLLTPVQNANVFGNSQNLITSGMVIRAPNNQSGSKVVQNNSFLSSPNQYLVNSSFNGQLSPMMSVSPTQRNQEYGQNVVVQQPNTSNTTVVQQNTTIVQQTTMVSNQQTHPTPTLNLNQNFILNDKPNFILTSDKQNFILSPNNEKILINPNRNNFLLNTIDKQNFVINNIDKQNLFLNNFLDKKNTVSTQTQNQVLQISSSPSLVVATSNTMCRAPSFSGSPPDTTTLSPADQEVSTSLQPTSPDQSLPMVHCISSSSQQAESYQLDSFNEADKSAIFDTTNLNMQLQGKNHDFARKKSLSDVPDSINLPNGGQESSQP